MGNEQVPGPEVWECRALLSAEAYFAALDSGVSRFRRSLHSCA